MHLLPGALGRLHATPGRRLGAVGSVIELLERLHPDVAIFTPVVDKELNAHKFIVPGLGDFGDRLYGTI